ncbi:MAG: 2-oxoacid:ferredoxin oxidoreductase subunit gamma [candidate division Zixibacteria bacterium]|nr:2-oxoacid:ferredoxin oxidoreductase subunit gamma [candidate division Zixibacteria bacterium]
MSKNKSQQSQSDRYEIRLSGSGGQGLILAGVMLAEAMGVEDGKNVVQTQSYGPEARGGASRADVVVSTDTIYYPKPMGLDLLLALTQEACDTYFSDLREHGILIIDSDLVHQPPTPDCFAFPFTQLAKTEIGHVMVANVISLGAIVEITKLSSKDAVKKVVKSRAPVGTEEKNLKALEVGFKIAREKMKSSKAAAV